MTNRTHKEAHMRTRISLTAAVLAAAALAGASAAGAARLEGPGVGASGSLARLSSHHVAVMEVRHTQTGLTRIDQVSVPLETRTR